MNARAAQPARPSGRGPGGRPGNAADAAETDETDERPFPPSLAVFGAVVYCAVGVLSGLIEVLLVPLYIGSAIFPITLLFAIVGNVALPRLVRILIDSSWAIAAPLVGWIVAVVALSYVNPNGGTVIVPGYGNGQYVGLGLFFGGTLAGFVGVLRELGELKAAEARAAEVRAADVRAAPSRPARGRR